jgi:hypothetical protein
MKDGKSAFPYVYETSEADRGGYYHTVVHHGEGMTLKEYAAIHLKVPRSGDAEIDAMIRESRKAEFAGQIIGGRMAAGKVGIEGTFLIADAMLAEWEEGAEK